jgi:hypothetical protein
MRLDNYQQRICTRCRRDYETADSESKICPLCRSDELRCKAKLDPCPSRVSMECPFTDGHRCPNCPRKKGSVNLAR